MNAFFFSGRYYSLPAAWDQLTARQLVAATDVLLLQTAPREEKELRLLKILCGWSWFKFAKALMWFRWNPIAVIRQKISRSSRTQLTNMTEAIHRSERFATAASELTAFLFMDITLTKNILPKYRGLHGPADELANLKMGEFTWCEFAFTQWKANGDPKFLNELVSFLYRPAAKRLWPWQKQKPVADVRAPFDPNLCAMHIRSIERWPLAVRVAIGTMYGSMRKKKIEENPRVFSEQTEDAGSTNMYGLWSVMRQVAKEGHFGHFKEIEETYVDTILMELNESLAEAEKREEEMDKMKMS